MISIGTEERASPLRRRPSAHRGSAARRRRHLLREPKAGRRPPSPRLKSSAVNSTLCSASQSEIVWSRFLPSDYRDIISGSVDACAVSELAKIRSKKDLYLSLCDNLILIDNECKSFSLEKLTEKKCYILRARDLVDDFEAWGRKFFTSRIIFLPESRFHVAVELEDMHKFYIRGDIKKHVSISWHELQSIPSVQRQVKIIWTCYYGDKDA